MEKHRVLLILLLTLAMANSQLSGNLTQTKTRLPPKRMSATNPKPKTKRDSYSYSSHYDYPSSSRKLAVPKGTTVSLTPAMTLPIIPKQDDASIQFESTMKMEFPMTLTFNDMSLGFFGESLFDPLFVQKKSLWDAPSYQNSFGTDAYTSSNYLGGSNTLHSRKMRDLFSVNSGNHTHFVKKSNCESKSLSDRKMIFQKLEMILSTGFGLTNPKDCLLRAVCELHEVPKVASGFGLLGEFVMLTLSLKDILEECNEKVGDFFKPFAEAEVGGKSGKCKIYRKKCDKSLFKFY